MYGLTGSGHCFAAGRLSFVLGLTGPCVAYDTACSSGLVACSGASLAIRDGEVEQALLAGVNMMISPLTPIMLATGGMTSPSGRSHTFDSRADGFARGEACAAFALRPAAGGAAGGAGGAAGGTAAEVLGAAVRQDGKSASLTAPSGPAQQALLRATLAQAGVQAVDMCHVEAHGTGTGLGDPIEAGSLSATVLPALGGGGGAPALGGIKANVGHAEPAAGAVGLLTLSLRLRSSQAAPNAQLRALNPHVGGAIRGRGCALPTQLAPLGAGAGGGAAATAPACGGVSSFGLGGTIAHAVVRSEEAAAGSLLTPASALVYRRRPFFWEIPRRGDEDGPADASSTPSLLGEGEVAEAFVGTLRDHLHMGDTEPEERTAAAGGGRGGSSDALLDTPLVHLTPRSAPYALLSSHRSSAL